MAHAQQQKDPYLGKVIDGRYEILERIGEGGMGVVYKARQVPINRVVAVKMLNQDMAQDPNWVRRFENEARACSQLQHPNTIRMFDFGQTQEGRLFMTMEFLDGKSLREAIATEAPMPPQRVLNIISQCCASLAEAHAAGIIHRDIKPDNVFLLTMGGAPDFVKLLDFSVAKLLQENDGMRTQAGIVFGTPQYMSPEQGRGMVLDARSDLYALGILAYEMLSQYVPFHHDNPMMVLQMHVQHPVPTLPPTVPAPVQALVNKALAKEPNARFQSAGDMIQHCQQVLAQLGAAPVRTPPQVSAMPAPAHPQGGHPQGHPQGGHPQNHHPGPPPAAPAPAGFGPNSQTVVANPNPPSPAAGHPAAGHPGAGHPAAGHPAPGHPAAPSPAYPGAGPVPNVNPDEQTIIAGQQPVMPRMPSSDFADQHAGGEKTLVAGSGFPGSMSPAPAADNRFPPPGPAHAPHPHAHPQGMNHMSGQPLGKGPLPPRRPEVVGDDESGPPKTIILPDSEGVVSFTNQHQQAPAPFPGPGANVPGGPSPTPGGMPGAAMVPSLATPRSPATAAKRRPAEGSAVGLGFWALCVGGGLGIGILAYFIVLLIS